MLITKQSLVERLDGRAGDPRRRCRLFIPDQAVFIRDQPPFIQCWVYCHPDDSGPTERAAGSPSRRRQLTGRRCEGDHGRTELKSGWCRGTAACAHGGVIGIIGGMAGCAPPCAAGMEVAPPNGMAAAVALVDGAAQADGTDNAPTEVA
jgi:hypothetical protein